MSIYHVNAQTFSSQEKRSFLNQISKGANAELQLPIELFEGLWMISLNNDDKNLIY